MASGPSAVPHGVRRGPFTQRHLSKHAAIAAARPGAGEEDTRLRAQFAPKPDS
ncbi:MAG TPA: hypothetical protein VGS80_16735 [Ktedonobacterales bacterium]|nr:hypothetical protein [Ktedonobacterales bacterium]